MFRIISILFLPVLVLLGCEDSEPTPKAVQNYKVGVLSGLDLFEPAVTGFMDQMEAVGYEDGTNIQYLVERAKGNDFLMSRIAKSFVEQEVDLILTTTNRAALLAKEATVGTDIPVVFTIVMSPIETGIIDSLTNPSGNVTGVRNPLGEFIGKRLEILTQLKPQTKNILILHDPDYPTAKTALRGLRSAADALKLNLTEIIVKTPQDVLDYLAKEEAMDHDAILIMPDITVQNKISLAKTFSFAKIHKIPVVANTPVQVESGALFSYFTDSYDAGRAAAQLANKALGERYVKAHPVISVEPQLVLNVRVAKSLGLIVDDSLLSLSHRTVE